MMEWTAADTVAGHLTAALAGCRLDPILSDDAVRTIGARITERLPAAMSTMYGFECRLGDAAADADFLLSIGGSPEQWRALSALAARADGDTWRRLAGFLGDAAARGEPPRPDITGMWLEFDLAGARALDDGWPDPSVFVGSRRLTRASAASTTTLAPEAEWLPSTIDALTGAASSAARRGRLATCLASLPEGARLFQIGVMLSRPDRGVRVCARGFGVDEIVPYLTRIGWPGAIEALAAELARLRPLTDDIRVDLDIADDLQATIGLECYWTEPARAAGFLGALVTDGLSLPIKAAAAWGWAGITHQRRHADRWPVTLLARCPAGQSSVFVRWLHHVKIHVAADGARTAKAYLAVAPRFVSDADIKAALLRRE